MTKKGAKGTYHKPKPRLAVYGGVAIGVLRAGDDNIEAANILTAGKGQAMERTKYVVNAVVEKPLDNAARIGIPATAGILASVAADKLGVNKVLAKMKFPVRV